MQDKGPCYDCKDRSPGCHGHCEAYIEHKQRHDAKVAEYRKWKREQAAIDEFSYNRHSRHHKKKH